MKTMEERYLNQDNTPSIIVEVILLVLLLVMSSGCAPQKIITEPIEKPRLSLQDPDPLALSDVTFVVVTRQNAESVFKDLEAKGLKPVLVALSGTDYKLLAINMADLEKFIVLEKNCAVFYLFG